MRFSVVFSVLACGAMALAAAVAPDVLVKRDNTQISSVLTGLNSQCDTILVKFDDCEDLVCTKEIVTEIVTVVKLAIKDVVGLVGVFDSAIVKLIADIVTKIITKLDHHKSTCGDQCEYSSYSDIDDCISALLKQLNTCIVGIVLAIAALLGSIVATLKALALTLILAVCKLN